MSFLVSILRLIPPLFMILSLGGLVDPSLLKPDDIAGFVHTVWHALAAQSFAFSYDRLVLLLVFGLSTIMFIEWLATHSQPVSVISSSMSVDFKDATGHLVSVSRTQYLRANHPDVTAYFTILATAFGGKVLPADVTAEASIRGATIASRLEMPPTAGDSKLEIAHVFDGGMPFGVLNVLLPLFLVRWLNRIGLQLPFIVRRDLTYAYRDEHILPDTYYELTADRYAQRDIDVSVAFHPGRPPKLSTGVLAAQSIRRNGIENIRFTARGGQFQTRIGKLQNQKLRIPFKF